MTLVSSSKRNDRGSGSGSLHESEIKPQRARNGRERTSMNFDMGKGSRRDRVKRARIWVRLPHSLPSFDNREKGSFGDCEDSRCVRASSRTAVSVVFVVTPILIASWERSARRLRGVLPVRQTPRVMHRVSENEQAIARVGAGKYPRFVFRNLLRQGGFRDDSPTSGASRRMRAGR